MCNNFSNIIPVEEMRRIFGVERDHTGNQPPLRSIFPRHEAPVVRLANDGKRELLRMHWGFLMPQVSKKTGQPILPKAVNNARDDKVRNSPFWRSSFAERRCLVPASSFCETKGRAPATHYWFGLKGEQERPPFAFAGLWRSYRGNYRGELVEIDSHTIVTTNPNELVRTIHPDRMPGILHETDYDTWLQGSQADAFRLLKPYPAEMMRIVHSGVGENMDVGHR